jgi:hypothetical protein
MFEKKYGRQAHERAVELGMPLPEFHAHDVDVEYYRRQQTQRQQRKQEEQLKQYEQQKQQEQKKQQEVKRQQQELLKQEKQTRRKELRQHQKLRKHQDPNNQRRQQDAQHQQQPQQRANEMPWRGLPIALPSIQPQLYPPPGPEEEWSQQQASEWQWQHYCCYMQQFFLEHDQEFQNQHPQWQQFYRQYQLQYWHRQQAQYYATLSTLTLPDPANLSKFRAPPESFVATPNPGAAPPGHLASSVHFRMDATTSSASLAPSTHLPDTRPSPTRPRSPSPPRGRPEPFVHSSRRPLIPSLASGYLSSGHRNDHASPIAPPPQPRTAVTGPPLSLVAATTCSEPLISPATTVPGRPHGLPVSQSSFASDGVTWPVLGEAGFIEMMHEQQERQQQVQDQDYVHKCE